MSARVISSRLVLLAVFVIPIIATAQAPRAKRTLQVSGYPGEAALVQMNGRTYVEVEALARITNGSLGFQGNRIVLTPSPSGTSPEVAATATQTAAPGFSREFMKAGLEAMAAMREWGGTLKMVIQNGYPPGNSMAPFQARAADAVRMASVAASTDSDRSALELLTNELTNVQAWSKELVTARNSMSAANMSASKDALENDPSFQKILRCGQFLIGMFANGAYQDEATCH